MKYRAKLKRQVVGSSEIDGYVHFEHEYVIFTSDEGELDRLLVRDMRVTKGQKIYIDAAQSSLFITVLDTSILNDVHIKQSSVKIKDINTLRHQSKRIRNYIIAVMVFFVMMITLLYLFKDKMVDKIIDNVPPSLEQRIGEQYIQSLSLMHTIDSTSVGLQELRKKAKLIFDQVQDTAFRFKVYIVDDLTVNAFALPGGYIVFNKGLLTKADSWEEVLGVMAHEAAHVTQRHHIRGILSQMGWTTILRMLIGDGGLISDLLIGTSAQLETLSYSRDYERESDEVGFNYLVNAKINPMGLGTFFEKLKHEHGDETGAPELLSSHPSTDNRIKAIDRLIATHKFQKDYIEFGDYCAFKDQIQ
jgi:beta-barrel assembly-enhancing protease